MVEFIAKVSGKKRKNIIVPKERKHLVEKGDYVKVIKLEEDFENDNKIRS